MGRNRLKEVSVGKRAPAVCMCRIGEFIQHAPLYHKASEFTPRPRTRVTIPSMETHRVNVEIVRNRAPLSLEIVDSAPSDSKKYYIILRPHLLPAFPTGAPSSGNAHRKRRDIRQFGQLSLEFVEKAPSRCRIRYIIWSHHVHNVTQKEYWPLIGAISAWMWRFGPPRRYGLL